MEYHKVNNWADKNVLVWYGIENESWSFAFAGNICTFERNPSLLGCAYIFQNRAKSTSWGEYMCTPFDVQTEAI